MRPFFLVLLILVIGVGLTLAVSDSARRSLRLRVAELAGDVATRVVTRTAGHAGSTDAADFIQIPVEVRRLDDSIYQATGVANTQVIITREGNVVFDTGLATQAAKQMRLLREAIPDRPITYIILSHSHQDHIGGTQFWREAGTRVVASRHFPEEERYQKELQDYFWFRNRTFFPFIPKSPQKSGRFAYGNVVPDVLVGEPQVFRFEEGGVRFEVIPTPGAEGDDNICLWLPERKILFSGDFFGPNFPQFPNIFTMRGGKVRKPIEYIHSLDRILALGPETIIPSHLDPIRGADRIRTDMTRIRDAVRYVHDATVAGMNAGKTMEQLMAEIHLPPELALTQIHGKVSWAVKSIWEYYATWFHFDSTTELYAVPPSAVQPEIAELAGVEALIEHARKHVEASEPLRALQLLQVALAGDPANRAGLEVRREALEELLHRAQAETRNSYELYWLRYRIRATNAALAPAL